MNKQEVIVILYPGCIFFEISLAVELLADKYKVTFATPDGKDHSASNGSVIGSTISYNDIKLDNCRALLIPGGDPGTIKEDPILDKVIQAANERELLLGAICAGPFVLAKAGVLRNKEIAHGYESEQLDFLKAYFEGVNLTDDMVKCDGHIITAKPDAYIDFSVEVACRLGAADASKANRIKDYYRGTLGKKIRPLSLALIKNSSGQLLLLRGFDSVKNEHFYRPLGGGIEFSESSRTALEREIMEELGQEVFVSDLEASFENIFTFDGIKGHEIIMLYTADFKNKEIYNLTEIDIFESGVAISKAVWRSVKEIKSEGSKLYPNGLEAVVER